MPTGPELPPLPDHLKAMVRRSEPREFEGFPPDTTTPTADRDDLAAILAKHGWEWTDGFRELICDCDEFVVDGYAEAPDGLPLRTNGQDTEIAAIALHRVHVAQMVLESDWLRDIRSSAWREGHGTSCDGILSSLDGCEQHDPYRADRVDADTPDNTTDRT